MNSTSALLSSSEKQIYAGKSMNTSETLLQSDTIEKVALRCPPLWDLENIVAVNPYLGFTDTHISKTDKILQSYLTTTSLPSLEVFRSLYEQQSFQKSDIQGALERREQRGVKNELTADAICTLMHGDIGVHSFAPATFAAWLDYKNKHVGNWKNGITIDIGRLCASRYDTGISKIKSFTDGELFHAWHRYASISHAMEARGLKGFKTFVSSLPLHYRDVFINNEFVFATLTQKEFEGYLFALIGELPGWAGYLRQQAWNRSHTDIGELGDLLAIRFCYDLALLTCETHDQEKKYFIDSLKQRGVLNENGFESEARQILLESLEIAYQKSLFDAIHASQHKPLPLIQKQQRADAQVVLCIDVRSEVLRRHITAVNPNIKTYGFAGFFGLPISIGEHTDSQQSQCPVLLTPSVQATPASATITSFWKSIGNQLSKISTYVSSTGVSGLSYVESWGMLSIFSMLENILKPFKQQHLTVNKTEYQLAASLEEKINLANGILKGISLSMPLSRIVILCGHQSTSTNNPIAASLQCGACAGHSGAPNAYIAANLLNQKEVREGLRAIGVTIPEDTLFIPAVHDTTADAIEFLQEVPSSHTTAFLAIQQQLKEACSHVQRERMKALTSEEVPSIQSMRHEIAKRTWDNAQVRPEWGLAGNAAFIVAGFDDSKDLDLKGRSFLHHYDSSNDHEGTTLETILTAPAIVASWINLQYYGSSIAPHYYGSGLKTLHNICAGIGVICGNDGDLAPGLSAQSVHTGAQLQHIPVRLHIIVKAEQTQIDRIIAKHKILQDLISNEWVLLFSASSGLKHIEQRTALGNWIVIKDH